jgi:hypothetical protein
MVALESLASNDVLAWAVARRLRRVYDSPQPKGFRGLGAAAERCGREQSMKENHRSHEGSQSRATETSQWRKRIETRQEISGFDWPTVGYEAILRNQILRGSRGSGWSGSLHNTRERKAGAPPGEELITVEIGQRTFTFGRVPREVETSREKVVEATAGYLATVIGNPLFTVATRSWQTESYPVTETVGVIEGVSGHLQGAVDAPLKIVGAALGLTPGEATFTAGVSTNLILAPITGPLDKAESYLEIGGIIFGIITGGHGLVLACIKPLLHSQFKHLLARGLVEMVDGLSSTHPQSDTPAVESCDLPTADTAEQARLHEALTQPMTQDLPQRSVTPPARFTVRDDLPRKRHEPTPDEPLWLCLAFVSKETTSGSVAHTAEPNAAKPVVLPMGDDAFLRTLPDALRCGTVSEVGVPTSKSKSDLSRAQHFVIQAEGIHLGTFNASRGSQAAYQHPGCLTGRCVPPGRRPCPCPCSVCRS